jgi:tetratricopeptide (TPR) repeat protein
MKKVHCATVIALFLTLAALGGCATTQTAGQAKEEFNRGFSLFNRGKYAEAAEAFEKTTELQADYGEAYLYLGRSYLSQGKWREALPPLRAAYRLSPDLARKEAGELILDVLVRHASDIDPVVKGQFEELIKGE